MPKKQPVKPSSPPVWGGPVEEGITFSLLSRYLTCKERFRLLVINGLRPVRSFNHRIEYGSMWHVCEEALAASTVSTDDKRVAKVEWEQPLRHYATELCDKYPTAQEQIKHWYEVCRRQFPVYIEYWRRHPDVLGRTPLLQEQVFDVPYQLPSGRTVRLRGKWDSVDLIKGQGIYLQENKTKGDIDIQQIARQLSFDLQTLMYLVALDKGQSLKSLGEKGRFNIKGVRYNVVRRPLSGGKGSIKQKKGESTLHYYERMAQYIVDEPKEYFERIKVEVSEGDITDFRRTCLDGLLENLCDDYEWWQFCHTKKVDPFTALNSLGLHDHRCDTFEHHHPRHYRHPFGVRNVMDEGGHHDLDNYLATGSTVGLERVSNLFEELD